MKWKESTAISLNKTQRSFFSEKFLHSFETSDEKEKNKQNIQVYVKDVTIIAQIVALIG